MSLPSVTSASELLVDQTQGTSPYLLTGNLTSDTEIVGRQSTGTLNQDSFSHTITNTLTLGEIPASRGTIDLKDGNLNVTGGEFVGLSGHGAFTQSGGSHTVSGSGLALGLLHGSSGSYDLQGGSLEVSIGGRMYFSGGEAVGFFGSGTFHQSGGSHTVCGDMGMGYNTTGIGTFNLSGGNLAIFGGEGVGLNGIGVFTQSGGSHTVGGGGLMVSGEEDLTLGYAVTGRGSFYLSGGSLAVNGRECVGWSGSGSFNQTGGVHAVSGDLTLGYAPTGIGTYNLQDGSLSALNVNIGTSGTGSFTQDGGSHTITGTLALAVDPGSSGTYNLRGGSLNAGTITLNTGGTFNQTGGVLSFNTFNQQGGTVTGSLTNRGTFNYTSGIFSGTLVNYGTANFYSDFNPKGGMENNAGAIYLNTVTFTGNLILDQYSVLKGNGSVNGNFTNQGSVSPGNSTGTLNVVGSYTQGTTGILEVEVASPTNYDKLAVTGEPGTATLAGTLAPTLLGGYRPLGNQVIPDIITTSGGIKGSFDNVANQSVGPTLLWQPRYLSNSVDLLVQRNYVNPGLGLNSNQQRVGVMLNSVAGATSGDLNAMLNAIDSLPASANVQDAFKQISPEKAGALATLGFAAAAGQMRNLATRTTNLRFVQGGSPRGGSLNPKGLSPKYSQMEGIMLAYNGASLSDLFSVRKIIQAPESQWGFFVDGGAAFGSQDSTVNQTGYNFTLGGFTVGGDYRLRDHLLVGLATGYGRTSADFYGSGGFISANTVPFNAYAAYFPGSLYAFGSLGYALNLFDLERGINVGGLARSASSSTTGHQFNLYGETGYDFSLSRFILTPSATLAYSALWLNGFTEQGAGAFNLKVASQAANTLQTGIGGRLTVPLQAGSVKVVPQGYAFYQHEFANGSRSLSASLSQGSSAFNFQTDTTGRNFGLLGASLTVSLKKNLYAQVNYNAEVGRGDSTVQYLNAGLRYEF
ncbi:MAG: autotransporter domain-containing protein [Thermodesulfobacteriota bacterium]